MLGGYLSFVVSIAGIGALTAVIGDVASHFGCTVGLEDAVTAIAFVALGTSVPGMTRNDDHNQFINILFFLFFLINTNVLVSLSVLHARLRHRFTCCVGVARLH